MEVEALVLGVEDTVPEVGVTAQAEWCMSPRLAVAPLVPVVGLVEACLLVWDTLPEMRATPREAVVAAILPGLGILGLTAL